MPALASFGRNSFLSHMLDAMATDFPALPAVSRLTSSWSSLSKTPQNQMTASASCSATLPESPLAAIAMSSTYLHKLTGDLASSLSQGCNSTM